MRKDGHYKLILQLILLFEAVYGRVIRVFHIFEGFMRIGEAYNTSVYGAAALAPVARSVSSQGSGHSPQEERERKRSGHFTLAAEGRVGRVERITASDYRTQQALDMYQQVLSL